MCIYTPLFILGSRSLNKERYVITRTCFTVFSPIVVVCRCRGIEVGCQINGAIGRGLFGTVEMKHIDGLGIE